VTEDLRIVHLPVYARRGVVEDGQAVGGPAEPPRFRSRASLGRASHPMPLRARRERSKAGMSVGVVADLPPPPPIEPPTSGWPLVVEDEPAQTPALRRVMELPIMVGAALVLTVLAVIGVVLGLYTANRSSDEPLAASARPIMTAPAAVPTPVPPVSTFPPVKLTPATAATAVAVTTLANTTQLPVATGLAQPGAREGPGATIFEERFVDNANKWPTNLFGAAWLTSGSYRIAARETGRFVAIGAPIVELLQDVIVTASFRKVGGPAGGGYGIIVRDQAPVAQNGTSQDGRYYVLEVGDKGEVGIWRRDGDHWVDLAPWQASAAAVKPDTAPNELTVRATGGRLSLSVNGTEVVSRTDATYPTGRVGIFIGGDGNEVALDSFSVHKL
jgi:hypothetical protein